MNNFDVRSVGVEISDVNPGGVETELTGLDAKFEDITWDAVGSIGTEFTKLDDDGDAGCKGLDVVWMDAGNKGSMTVGVRSIEFEIFLMDTVDSETLGFTISTVDSDRLGSVRIEVVSVDASGVFWASNMLDV